MLLKLLNKVYSAENSNFSVLFVYLFKDVNQESLLAKTQSVCLRRKSVTARTTVETGRMSSTVGVVVRMILFVEFGEIHAGCFQSV